MLSVFLFFFFTTFPDIVTSMVIFDPTQNEYGIGYGNTYELTLKPESEVRLKILNETLYQNSVILIKSLESPIVLKNMSTDSVSSTFFIPFPNEDLFIGNPSLLPVTCEIIYEKVDPIFSDRDTLVGLRHGYLFLLPSSELELTFEIDILSVNENEFYNNILTIIELDIFLYNGDSLPSTGSISSYQIEWGEAAERELEIQVSGIPQFSKIFCVLDFTFIKQGSRSGLLESDSHNFGDRSYQVRYESKGDEDQWLKFSLGVISFCLAVVILLNSVCLFFVCICCFLIPRFVYHLNRIQSGRRLLLNGEENIPVNERIAMALAQRWEDLVLAGGVEDVVQHQGPVLEEPDEIEYAKRRFLIREEDLCVICLDMRKVCVFNPCGHESCCQRCTQILMETTKVCPVCRSEIVSSEVKEDKIKEDVEKLKELDEVSYRQQMRRKDNENIRNETVIRDLEGEEEIDEVEEDEEEKKRLISSHEEKEKEIVLRDLGENVTRVDVDFSTIPVEEVKET